MRQEIISQLESPISDAIREERLKEYDCFVRHSYKSPVFLEDCQSLTARDSKKDATIRYRNPPNSEDPLFAVEFAQLREKRLAKTFSPTHFSNRALTAGRVPLSLKGLDNSSNSLQLMRRSFDLSIERQRYSIELERQRLLRGRCAQTERMMLSTREKMRRRKQAEKQGYRSRSNERMLASYDYSEERNRKEDAVDSETERQKEVKRKKTRLPLLNSQKFKATPNKQTELKTDVSTQSNPQSENEAEISIDKKLKCDFNEDNKKNNIKENDKMDNPISDSSQSEDPFPMPSSPSQLQYVALESSVNCTPSPSSPPTPPASSHPNESDRFAVKLPSLSASSSSSSTSSDNTFTSVSSSHPEIKDEQRDNLSPPSVQRRRPHPITPFRSSLPMITSPFTFLCDSDPSFPVTSRPRPQRGK
ncbi:uncharacterized protein MONOS_1442 [Monocercomonoides exilis]|uniref:uncharacterized protein n=1 Tax=Monocercomonoides exilis TaxID=2049356 RepID=UPI00355A5926|nr:hypothetical protein MONOS_1442 [Monocercomonoides exilis]|eukprot:MONOS_1442.1-p1 / transcript=MONOS_1442.1 / gene=MONOS_1442 / organism=Monocercomonoides_exilis_PA203 / gene_product=unspecified product / transcript_product=unspecified product / location=Mono_scaffold00025:193884-195200(+) / protein_length=418 / sequence_SO=supercontig / SO=protein_coding / is_pseudo=false